MNVYIAVVFGLLLLLWGVWLRYQLFTFRKRRTLKKDSAFGASSQQKRYQHIEERLLHIPRINTLRALYTKTGVQVPWLRSFVIIFTTLLALFLLLAIFVSFSSAVLVLGVSLLVLYILYVITKNRHHQQLVEALPEFLDLVYNSLQAGNTSHTAWKLAAEQAPEPLDIYVNRHFRQLDFSRKIEDILRDFQEDVDINEISMIISSVTIQNTIGGQLAPLLNTVASTIRQRTQLQKDVKALTAQGRLSGYVVAALWPISFLLFSYLSPGYFDILFDTLLGQLLLIISVLLELLGFWIISRIIDIQF